MPNIRTANKNHKRVLAAQVARDKVIRTAPVAVVTPVKTKA